MGSARPGALFWVQYYLGPLLDRGQVKSNSHKTSASVTFNSMMGLLGHELLIATTGNHVFEERDLYTI